MPISDNIKAQSYINHVGQKIASMRERLAEMQALRTAIIATRQLYIDQAVDPTGTPLEGNVATLNTALTNLNTALANLDTELNSAVFDTLIAAIEPTHRGTALDGGA